MAMEGSLSGKRIAIIGGSSGIGRAIAVQSLAEGAEVILGSRDKDRLAAAVADLGEGAQACPVDVTIEASIAEFFAASAQIDHLVFTAGDWARRKTMFGKSFSLGDAQASFEVRFWGLLRMIEAALPHLSAEGSIVLTGGLLAHRPQKGQAISSALTGAVEHLARGLAVDLAPVRVNCVVPGFIGTEVWSRMPAEAIDAMVAGQPISRPGHPEEVAEAYLSFMRSSYTTGQAMIVDGGMMLA